MSEPDPRIMLSTVTELLVDVAPLPEGFQVRADSRFSVPVCLTYWEKPEETYRAQEVRFTLEQAKVIGAALVDAAGALEAQLKWRMQSE